MPLGYKIEWDDEWIAKNFLRYPSYRTLTEAYNERFDVYISPSAMNGHCKNDLGMTKPRTTGEFLTEEQKKFIEETYPHHSVAETTMLFNERFGTAKKKHTMRNYADRHGLKVDEEIVLKSKLDAVRKEGSKRAERKIGDVRFDGRHWVMKTEEGWKSANRAVWEKHHGKVKDGYAVIHLDGDCGNYDIENLMEVPSKYLGILQGFKMRSSNAEITKTAVMWCELYELIGE